MACEISSKKRPPFDIIRKRIPNLCETYKKINSKRGSLNLVYPNSKWQKQHIELIKNLRYQEEENSYSDYIVCPYCMRKFSSASADKHIESCKNVLNKPKPLLSVEKFPKIKKMNKNLVKNASNGL